MQNRTQASVPALVQITQKEHTIHCNTVRSGNPTGSHHVLTPQSTEMVYDRKDCQPPFGIPKDAKTAPLLDWNLTLNQAHTYAIRPMLKFHAHPDDGKLGSEVIT